MNSLNYIKKHIKYYTKNKDEFRKRVGTIRKFIPYDREAAAAYAKKWALSHNPIYKNYEDWGGDCTNFISQSVHAGKIPMDNQGPDVLYKWYWYSDSQRTPSWTAAEPFYQYISKNNTKDTDNFGIYTRLADYDELELGDLVQLLYEGKAYHTMIITEVVIEGEYLIDYYISQHTYDLQNYPLSLKTEGDRRYIKILGHYK